MAAMSDIDRTTPAGVAEFIAYMGHQGDASLTRHGFTPDAVRDALAAGLIAETPRLGGYTATRRTNTRHFGQKFADAVR